MSAGEWTPASPKKPGYYWISIPSGLTGWDMRLKEVRKFEGKLVLSDFLHIPFESLKAVKEQGGLWWSEPVFMPVKPKKAVAKSRIQKAIDLIEASADSETVGIVEPDMMEGAKQDAADLRVVASRLRNGDGPGAYAFARSLDTFVLEGIPRFAWEVLDSFGETP